MFGHYTFGSMSPRSAEGSLDDIPPCSTLAESCDTQSESSNSIWTPECDDISQSYIHSKPKPTVEVELSLPLFSGLMVDEEPSMPWDPSYTIQSPFRPCRRAQRQLNATLLYTKSEAQLHSIEALVEEMVHSGSQCNVSLPRLINPSIESSQSTSFSASPADGFEPVLDTSQLSEVDSNDNLTDEGFFEGESGDDIAAEAVEDLLLNLRQAESPSGIRRMADTAEQHVLQQTLMDLSFVNQEYAKRLEFESPGMCVDYTDSWL